MGAEIAYEVYHKVADECMNLPVHMFFSARKAPHVNNGAIRYHALPYDQFKEEITRLNGIPDFVKESDEVFDFLSPVILSDCRMIETHRYQEKQTLISCKITVIYGSKDAMTEGTTGHEWALHSADQCSVFHIDANHFFIMDKCKEIADIINAVL
jgi:surfactin synthase thioesterase subunit